jgi:hypothetical protein
MRLRVLAGQFTHHNRVLPVSIGNFFAARSPGEESASKKAFNCDCNYEENKHSFLNTKEISRGFHHRYFFSGCVAFNLLGNGTEGTGFQNQGE